MSPITITFIFLLCFFVLVNRIRWKQQRERNETATTDTKTIKAEQQRQAKELEKHEKQLAKHEAEIEKLKATAKAAQFDYTAATEKINRLYALLDIAEQQQRDAHPGSKGDEKAMRKVSTLCGQLDAAEKKRELAKDKYTAAMKKLQDVA